MFNKISLLILALLLVTVLIACSSNSADSSGNVTTAGDNSVSDEETTAGRLTDNLPDKDLDGWTLNIVAHHDGLSNESTIFATELNGEIINDAIYQRNSSLESRFNFTMEVIPGNGWASDYTMLKNSVLSGSGEFDLAFMLPYSVSGNLVFDGYLANMLDIEYIDYSKPWWHSNVNEMFTFFDYLPFASSDFLLSSYQYANILIFNKLMAENYSVESIPDHIRNGTWTLDKFKETISVFSNDMNGDGLFDVNDMYGFTTNFGYHAITWGYAVGEVGVKLADTGVTLGYQTERFSNLAEWLYSVLYAGNLTFEIGWDKECDIKWDENRVFIQAMWLADLEKYREYSSEYTIIPYPKYNETQELYHTYMDARAGAVAIPITADDESRANTGLILEALACASYNDVVPLYLESVTHSKYSRDPESIEMLDYISAGRVWDIGYTFFDPQEYSWVIHKKLKTSDGNLTSALASMEESATIYYEKILDAYKELGAR
jgi:hypothetical protein